MQHMMNSKASHQSISATPADCEPLWQTIFGCVLFAAVCGLSMIVL
jgi:hypothetical protein